MSFAFHPKHPSSANQQPPSVVPAGPGRRSKADAGHISGIDGLRALAVLAVLTFHLHAPWLPGGFVGVDVFFVVSGYVVSLSLAQRSHLGGAGPALAFYARRARRLLPALVLCLAVTTALTVLFIPRAWLSHAIDRTGVAAFFGASNLALVRWSDGYFSPRADYNPFTHTWSLAVEEQFYLVFPWLFLAGQRARPTLARGASWLLPALAVASLAWAAYETHAQPAHAFYLPFARFWELALGSLLYQAHAGEERAHPRRGGLALWFGALGLPLFMVSAPVRGFPFPGALIPCVATLACLDGAIHASAGHPLRRALESRVLRPVGAMSYSLYLWHWPVFTLLRWTTGLDSPVWQLAALVATTGLASASYYWVELRTRRLPVATTRDARRVLTRLVLMTAGVAGAATATFYAQPQLTLSVTGDASLWSRPSAYDAPSSSGTLAGPTLFLVGDSHALAYTPLVINATKRLGIQYRRLATAGGRIARITTVATAGPARDFTRDTLETLRRSVQPGDIVFFASLRMTRISDPFGRLPPASTQSAQLATTAPDNLDRGLAEARAIVELMTGLGAWVLFDAPKPVFLAPAFRCMDWFNRKNPVCAPGLTIDAQLTRARRAKVLAALQELASEHPRVRLWDPLPELCDIQKCYAVRAGLPLFIDGDHLSMHGNAVLLPSFVDALKGLVP